MNQKFCEKNPFLIRIENLKHFGRLLYMSVDELYYADYK